MSNRISLSAYVKKRNGVALGGKHSLSNMLHRSLGARSFPEFWHYWNPIWGYYLARYVMKPCARYLPNWLAVMMTFAVSGALHDIAVMIVKWKPYFIFTPWFVLMGLVVVVSHILKISYYQFYWLIRAFINLIMITACLCVTLLLSSII